MTPRIAIPLPHTQDGEYSARALPDYARAVEMAGGEPVTLSNANMVGELMDNWDAVLLPGSPADVDPAAYAAARNPHCAAADLDREKLDRRLLDAAYPARKPVLGVCYGLQSLNVYCGGTLVQHVAGPVEHEAKRLKHAHRVIVKEGSRLAHIVRGGGGQSLELTVNSSHHQAAERVGAGLFCAAQCPEDGMIEALEGASLDHFVLAVQWHPERSLEEPASQALFRALVAAARRHGE
jgi:putative glutamine amidotransferase